MYGLGESLLEMHYYRTILDSFRTILNIAPGDFEIFKYSPQIESYIGFDLGLIRHDTLTEEELVTLIRDSVANNRRLSRRRIFFGFFLQFKVLSLVTQRNQRSPVPPAGYQLPYFRTKLKTVGSARAQVSQHATLFRIALNSQCQVFYVCPAIGSKADLYRDPDLNDLLIAPVLDSRSEFADRRDHHLYFPWLYTDSEFGTFKSEETTTRLLDVQEMVDEIVRSQIQNDSAALLSFLTRQEAIFKGVSPEAAADAKEKLFIFSILAD